jgi:hypothetical protein
MAKLVPAAIHDEPDASGVQVEIQAFAETA